MGQNVLRGTFVDSITGAPLPFVNAVYDEAGHGVTADLNGRFELTTAAPVERIIVSYVGYKPAIFTISESMRQQEARYPLRQQHVDIEAVYVTSAENPAVLLLRRALAKRSLHSPRALPGYRFISYNKMLVTIRDTATSNVDNGPFPHERDADATTHYLIINETVSRHFYRRPNTSVDSVISTRTSGLRRKSLPIVAGSMQSISFYNEDLTLLGSKYVNPFSLGGLMHYSYTLQDTMVGQGGDSVVAVRFQPKRTSHSSALSGVLYIAIGEYSLRNVIAYSSMDDRSGTFHIAQNYRRKGSHTWFPAELRTKVVMTGSDLYITNETHISDITIDTVVRKRVSLPLTSIVLAEADGLTVERTLDQYRATPLNYTELNTYRVTDSLSDTYKFENWADLATDFLDGYLWLKYVKLDLLSLLDYNNFEGFRLGGALETTSLFSSRFRLGGNYAYGFADREHKYGARIGARVWPQRDGWLDVRYSHDVATPGQPFFDEDRRGIGGSFYVRRMDYRSGAHLSLQGYISRKWQATLSLGYHRYTNLAGYGIPQVQGGDIYVAGADDYTLFTPRISLRFYPNLPLVQYPDGVRPLLSSPVRLSVHLQQGFEPIHRRARYTKLDAFYSRSWQSSLWGLCTASGAAGVVWGTYPLSQGYMNNGSSEHRSGFISWRALATLPPAHFYHDYQVAISCRYVVPSWMGIPLSSSWIPTPSVMVNALWGGQWHAYRDARQRPLPSAQKGLFEVGVGLAGILPGLSANASSSLMVFYRLGAYSAPYPKGNLGLALVYSIGRL